MEAKLFDRCKCKGFYKKAHDGIYIQLDRENHTADLMNSNNKDELVEKEIDCAVKRYYEHKDGNFSGIIVGFVGLVITGWLNVIYDCGVDVGFGTMPDRFYIQKEPKEVVKCAVVYYANNLKHYVPIEDILEILD